MTIAVSIIIPTYNYGHLLARAINSALNQTLAPLEIIVVDDGSTDNTTEIVTELQQTVDNHILHYIKQTNAGPGAARNLGIKQAHGDWLVFLDADDELRSDALQIWQNAVKQWPDTLVFFSDYFSNDPNKPPKYVTTPAFTTDRCENFWHTLFSKKYSTSTSGRLLLNKAVALHHTYAEHVRNGEDIPFVALLVANYPCQTINKATVNIYRHPTSLRHQHANAQNDMLQIVDTIFDSPLLPITLRRYKQSYLGRRYNALARVYLQQKMGPQTRHALLQAIKNYPALLLHLSLWKKLLKSYFI